MKADVITVGTTPVKVPVSSADGIVNGLRMLGYTANTGTVYWGTSPSITTSSGVNRVAKGDAATSAPTTVPAHHLNNSQNGIWLVADAAGQLVDWNAD